MLDEVMLELDIYDSEVIGNKFKELVHNRESERAREYFSSLPKKVQNYLSFRYENGKWVKALRCASM